MHAVALRNRGQGFAGSAALERFSALIIAQLALAAEFDAGSHSARVLAKAKRAVRSELGNLCLRKTPWWAREDSNLKPNDYDPPLGGACAGRYGAHG
jgi:hypothetical protein